jgi:hypothetical protein
MLKTTIELPAEAQAKLAAIRAKSLTDRHLEGPPFPGTKGEGIRFYLSLRAMIAKLKAARFPNARVFRRKPYAASKRGPR